MCVATNTRTRHRFHQARRSSQIPSVALFVQDWGTWRACFGVLREETQQSGVHDKHAATIKSSVQLSPFNGIT